MLSETNGLSTGVGEAASPNGGFIHVMDGQECRICHELIDHMDALFRMGYSLTRNAKDAEDLVQETYLRAVAKHDKFRIGTNLKAWLLTILKNAYINRYRREKKRPGQVDLAEVVPFIPGKDDSFQPEFSLQDDLDADRLGEELDESVKQALEELSPEFREIILLNVVEELSYKEIATLLSVPIGTVMSRLFRARKQMQSKLREYAEASGWIATE